MGAWRELWATWGGRGGFLAERQGSQTSPRCPTGLLSKRGPVTSPIRVSESEPAKQGWKSDDESGSSPLPGSAVL